MEGLACEKGAGRASNLRDTRDWDLFAVGSTADWWTQRRRRAAPPRRGDETGSGGDAEEV